MSYLGLGTADETGVVEDRILLWAERMRSAGHMPDEKSMNRLRQVSITGMQATLTQHLLPRLDAEILDLFPHGVGVFRSEEHTSELQSLMRISYAVFCLKK